MTQLQTIAAIARAATWPRGGLVIIDREVACSVCGRPLLIGSEARRWVGATVAHVRCVDELGGPAGR